MKEIRPGADSAPGDQGSSHTIRSDLMLGHQRKIMGPLILKGSVRGGPPANLSSEGLEAGFVGSQPLCSG